MQEEASYRKQMNRFHPSGPFKDGHKKCILYTSVFYLYSKSVHYVSSNWATLAFCFDKKAFFLLLAEDDAAAAAAAGK